MPQKPIWLPPKHGPIPSPVTTDAGLKRYDVSYSLKTGYRPLELELYVPESKTPVPIIVWVHGGGYAGGTRKEEAPWIENSKYVEKCLLNGFAIARIDYRLGKEAVFPAAVNDAHAALRWLSKFSEQLNLDVSQTFVWGASAGAHLAALTVNTFGHDYFEGTDGAEQTQAMRVVALVDWFGASDLNSIIRPMDGTDESLPEIARFPPEFFNLGSERWKDDVWRAKASPTNYINSASPETLMIHGDADTMVPLQQSRLLAEKLEAAGVNHKLVIVSGGEHAWLGLPQAEVNRLVDISIEYMKNKLN